MSAPALARDALADARERARDALAPLAAACAAEGMPPLALDGQLIRPVLAFAAAEALGIGGGEPLACAALAVQLAHEASLVHDDIVDGAGVRRGRQTAAAASGVGPALVLGDHLLAWGYRLAARTGSLAFVQAYADAVERTIAGEVEQGRAAGRRLDAEACERISRAKAGALLGCAAAAGPLLAGHADAYAVRDLGVRLGLVYQMLDDLLDYCPASADGKPALGDYAQGRWTWVLDALPDAALGGDAARTAGALHAPVEDGGSAAARCVARLEREVEAFRRRHALLLPGDPVLDAFAEQWLRRAMAAVSRERRGRCAARRVEAASHIRARVPGAAEWPAYFARNSRSFRFAARFLPAAEAERVARVYAYCRVTDDLVDRPVDGAAPWLERVLDEWVELSRRAYEGRATGLDLLDRAMGEMASAGVPFRYAAELAEGMRMDLRRQAYADTGELRTYTYRVASVVGLWLTELSGVHDPPTLRRAAAMGHAMQLTNILRDVGEDRRAGRLYLPADRLRAHGVTVEEIDRTLAGAAPVSTRYAALVAELMRGAEAEYALGFAAIPRLPRWFQAPVAVAAHVYRAIHGSIRRNGCDNLRLRARTGPAVKALAAVQAMWDLRRARGALAAGFELEPSEALVAWSPAP